MALFAAVATGVRLIMQGPLRVLASRWRQVGGRLLYAAVVLVPLAAGSGCVAPSDLPVANRQGNPPALIEPGSDAPTGPAGLARVEPVGIIVPKIGASSSLIPLGLTEHGELQTPPVSTPMQAGWYALGPTPGEVGPAVIVGHVDGLRQPGIFARLRELAPGDEIIVRRADSSLLRFTVRRTSQVPKDRFPTGEVYGSTVGPELRLITCGGSFDRDARSYRDNLIVYAEPRPFARRSSREAALG